MRRILIHSAASLTVAAAMLASNVFAQSQSNTAALPALIQTLSKIDDPNAQLNILKGINAALKGQRKLTAPSEWAATYERLSKSSNAELKQQAQTLAVTFGASGALDELRVALADSKLPMERRRAALDSLVDAKDAKSLPLLMTAWNEASTLRGPALRGLASYDSAEIPVAILGAYPKLSSEEKRDALATLCMRPAWAAELLKTVDNGWVPKAEISAPLARQLQDLKDPNVEQWLAANWGAVRTSSADKQKEIERFKAFLTPTSLQAADATHGRALFSQTCAVCHTIFGAGAKVGPELPGAFTDIDYLLRNILDPNAIIGKDYQQTVVSLKDGQTLIGIVGSEDAATLVLKSLAGPVTLQLADIAKREVLEISLMPEGLLLAMKEQDVRDLFAYLGRHGQVAMLASEMNINDFFNGVDLTRWVPSSAAWGVEAGEILAKSAGTDSERLMSDMVLRDARFRFKVSLRGKGASVELIAADPEESGTPGASFKLPISGDEPVSVELLRANGKTELRVNGGLNLAAHRMGAETSAGEGSRGVVIGFKLQGPGAELRVTEIEATLLKAK